MRKSRVENLSILLGRAMTIFGRAQNFSGRAAPDPAILWRRHYNHAPYFSSVRLES